MKNGLRFLGLFFGFVLSVLPLGAKAGGYPIGYCTCSGGSCSVYMGGTQWQTVSSCSSSSQTFWHQIAGQNAADSATMSAIDQYLGLFFGPWSSPLTSSMAVVSSAISSAGAGQSRYMPPADASAPRKGWMVVPGYEQTDFSANSAVAGDTRRAERFSVDLVYAQDDDEWGYFLVAPLKRTENNGVFGALDETSVGVAFMPVRHLMYRQVHGVDLDVGGVIGYDRHWMKDRSALTATGGAFGLAGYDDPSSWQIGVFSRVSGQVGIASVSGGLSHVRVRNLANKDLFGSGNALTRGDLAVRFPTGKQVFFGGRLALSHLSQAGDGVDADSGEIGLLLGGGDRRSTWQVDAYQSLFNSDYRTRGLRLSLGWLLE